MNQNSIVLQSFETIMRADLETETTKKAILDKKY
jgi:hypothetical protein